MAHRAEEQKGTGGPFVSTRLEAGKLLGASKLLEKELTPFQLGGWVFSLHFSNLDSAADLVCTARNLRRFIVATNGAFPNK